MAGANYLPEPDNGNATRVGDLPDGDRFDNPLPLPTPAPNSGSKINFPAIKDANNVPLRSGL